MVGRRILQRRGTRPENGDDDRPDEEQHGGDEHRVGLSADPGLLGLRGQHLAAGRTLGDLQRGAAVEALDDEADLPTLVRVALAPAFDALTEPGDEHRRRWQLLSRVMTDASPAMQAIVAEAAGDAGMELVGRIAARLPDLTPGELRLRHAAIIGAIGALGTGGLDPLLDATDRESLGDWLLTFIVGALSAPPTRIAKP